ncbi:growth hormone secretagogue receptor type 1-like [Amia ocellicauda]|uniref:growth hormone secretagogue receptor type 1-like n=1 Tax=Amia ocellicauda TaxID=2972642 RepID=UPI003464A112
MDAVWNLSLTVNATATPSPPPAGPLFELCTLAPVTAACLLLFLLGVGGNVATLLVFRLRRDLRTTTNLYLSSMALSDILIFAGLPLDLYRLWRYHPFPFGDFLCRFQFYLSETCTYATILHITALSVERYLAICFPLHAKLLVTRGRVRLVIPGLWAVAMATAGPVFFLFGVEGRECRQAEAAVRTGLLRAMTWVSTLYFFLPLVCLSLLYGLIGRKLWSTRRQVQGPSARQRERHHRHSVKILGMVVLSFALCWLPFHVGRILFSSAAWAGQEAGSLYAASQNFNLAAMLLFYLSASINPVLYTLLSARHRSALRCLLLPPPRPHTPRGSTHHSTGTTLRATEASTSV